MSAYGGDQGSQAANDAANNSFQDANGAANDVSQDTNAVANSVSQDANGAANDMSPAANGAVDNASQAQTVFYGAEHTPMGHIYSNVPDINPYGDDDAAMRAASFVGGWARTYEGSYQIHDPTHASSAKRDQRRRNRRAMRDVDRLFS